MKRIAVIIVKEKTAQKSTTTTRVDSSMIDLIFVIPRFFWYWKCAKISQCPHKIHFWNQKLRDRDGVAEVNDATKKSDSESESKQFETFDSLHFLTLSIATITPTIIYNFMWDSIFSVVFTQSIEQKSTVSNPFVSLYIFANKFILPQCYKCRPDSTLSQSDIFAQFKDTYLEYGQT